MYYFVFLVLSAMAAYLISWCIVEINDRKQKFYLEHKRLFYSFFSLFIAILLSSFLFYSSDATRCIFNGLSYEGCFSENEFGVFLFVWTLVFSLLGFSYAAFNASKSKRNNTKKGRLSYGCTYFPQIFFVVSAIFLVMISIPSLEKYLTILLILSASIGIYTGRYIDKMTIFEWIQKYFFKQ